MKVLSVRQPWAFCIMSMSKDIENRSWSTKFRGRMLLHAAQGMSRSEYEDCETLVETIFPSGNSLPEFDALQRGGIVGSIEITGCVTKSDSPWFFGPYGFVLANPLPLPFIPARGSLGFWEATPEIMAIVREHEHA